MFRYRSYHRWVVENYRKSNSIWCNLCQHALTVNIFSEYHGYATSRTVSHPQGRKEVAKGPSQEIQDRLEAFPQVYT